MKDIKYIQNSRIVFSQWSGKNYAVFASLGKVVNIAVLSVDICVQAVKKCSSVINSLLDTEYIRESVLEEYIDEINEILRDWIELPELMPVVAVSEQGKRVYIRLLNYKRY